MKAQRILILAPHTDDGELGCGATIAKYTEAGAQIFYAAFSSCSQSLPTGMPADTLIHECRNATGLLGINDARIFDFPVRSFSSHRQAILDSMLLLKSELDPHAVFLPAEHDVHQDHQVIYAEGLRAFKNRSVLGYDLPWNNVRFQAAYFETVSLQQIERKEAALQQYASQSHRDYMKPGFVRSLAKVRGVQAGVAYAEAFEIYRMIN